MKVKLIAAWIMSLGWVLPGATAEDVIRLECRQLIESSGVAISTLNPQIVWTHNDSGDRPRLFAFTREGKWIAVVTLDGAKAIDWEDMCSFEREGKHYLAAGDVGDNNSKRSQIDIYVIEEPVLDTQVALTQKLSIQEFAHIPLCYSTGSVNCESLAYDSLRDEFVLATKENLRCRLFAFPARPPSDGKRITARELQSIMLPLTTGADISRDGSRLIISTYGPACLLKRKEDGSWDTSSESLEMLALPLRKQGESIGFADEDRKILLTSEFAPTPLWILDLDTLRKKMQSADSP